MERKVMCNIPDEILSLLQKDIAEIKVALLGNEYNPGAGLVCRTTELESRLEKLQNKIDKIIWTAAGGAALLSIVVNVLWVLFKSVLLQ